ncbi:LexA family protein [Streptomyces sp. NPDC002853]
MVHTNPTPARTRRSWDITDRQQSVLTCIRNHIVDHGEAPSVREIGAAVGLSSPSSVLYQLRRLEQAGAVARARGTGWRDYRLT